VRSLLESLWGAAQIAFHIVTGPLLHRRRTRWGATADELRLPLPGDELVPNPDWSYTHAIGIRATRGAVWPWLVQIGQGRGGFYSYEGLENLVGLDIHNIGELRPELQRLRVGDTVRMHRSGFGPVVTVLEPGRSLVLGGPPNEHGTRVIWGFHLLDAPDGTTRLVERGRNAIGRGWLEKLAAGPWLLEPIAFVMSRKMLRTVKRLAESGGEPVGAAPTPPAVPA
jgi:hypothetical protein